MSDQNSSFPFESIGQEEGLEIAAIFGGGTPENNTNPFEAMMAQQAEPIAPPTQPQLRPIDRTSVGSGKRGGRCV